MADTTHIVLFFSVLQSSHGIWSLYDHRYLSIPILALFIGMTFGGVLSIICSGHDIPSDLPQIIHSLSRYILIIAD